MFIKYITSCFLIIFLGAFLFHRGGQTRNEINRFSGSITYLDKAYKKYPNRDFGKYRYLQLAGFPRTIELFIGKESGDFKPDFEKIDDLKVGEKLTVFYTTSFNEENDGICRLVQFIDRGTEPVFIKGSWDKLLGGVVGGFGIIIMACLVVLRRLKKIE